MRHEAQLSSTMFALAMVMGAACGNDTDTTASTSATQTTGTQTGTGASSQGGESSAGGGGPTGCVDDPSICPTGWDCCQGVPYPPEGQCYEECQFVSDRNVKHDIQPVDADALLERLAAVPVTSWRYDSAPQARHIGPMAQDFHDAFGLGDNDSHIASVDAAGVTIAAIQALHLRVRELQAASDQHERENAALRSEIIALRAALQQRP